MRINSISTIESCCKLPSSKTKNNQTNLKDLVDSKPPQLPNEPNFKGVGGAVGATIGTLAGIGLGTLLTIGTGGLAAPLVASMIGCAAGGISGDVLESKIKNSNGESDDDNNSDYSDYFGSSTYI